MIDELRTRAAVMINTLNLPLTPSKSPHPSFP
jgi:hypothetical protein